jgi:hypothetical protein
LVSSLVIGVVVSRSPRWVTLQVSQASIFDYKPRLEGRYLLRARLEVSTEPEAVRDVRRCCLPALSCCLLNVPCSKGAEWNSRRLVSPAEIPAAARVGLVADGIGCQLWR